MANLIQIKRSLTTATPTTLANGEMAYTANGDNLFIGSNGVVVAIGGKKNPGVLTANQALVANSTSGIDKIIVANAAITKIYANGTHGSTGYILASDSANNLYWQDPNQLTTAAAGSNGQIQFNGGTNDLTASDGLVFTVASNTLFVGNTFNVGTNVTLNTTSLSIGNSTVNTYITSTGIDTDGTLAVLGATTLSNTLGVTGLTSLNGGVNTTTANASSGMNVGANVNLTTTRINVGNSTVNTYITSTAIETDGTLSVLGAATLSNTLGVTGLTSLNGGVNTTTANASSAVNVGANVNLTTTAVDIGNSTVNSEMTSTQVIVRNASASTLSNTSGVYTTGTVNAAVLSVGTNIVGNSTQFTSAVNAVLNANTTLGNSNTDVVTFNAEIKSNIIPSANVTYNLGSSVDRWNYVYAANVHSSRGYFEGNVEIAGDLIVSGNVTTVNVSSLEVTDPLIYLAGNNYSSDLVDIGFVGNYYDGASQRHAGIVRHAADDKFYLFKGYTAEPDNNVIDVGNTSLGYQIAQLNAYLDSGALVTNSTAVSITANSTVAVNITANSITLNTPLAATSGGTGINAYSSGDLLVANTGNTLSKLGLGTDGQVLQSNGTALVYNSLDGGTF